MKKIYSTVMMLAMMVAALSFVSCGNQSNSKSSNTEDDTTDYVKIEKDAYKEGHADGYDDGSDGNDYLTSYNHKSGYHLFGQEKESQVWEKGYRSGYADGYNEGKAAYNSELEKRQETARQLMEEYGTGQVIVTTTSTPNTYSSSNSIKSDERIYSHLSNYEETDDCVEGVVVYEGEGDFYIVEARRGYTVLERYNGRLDEGDKVRGELNRYNFKYLYNRNNDSEVKVYIEDYMLSEDSALEWMGDNDHLKSDDQEAYDSKKNNN